MKDGYQVQYRDSTSILIVNGKGIIGELHTPFEVQCIEDIGRYKKGVFVYVEEVAAGERNQIIYFIGEGAYFHKHFRILLKELQ